MIKKMQTSRWKKHVLYELGVAGHVSRTYHRQVYGAKCGATGSCNGELLQTSVKKKKKKKLKGSGTKQATRRGVHIQHV